MDQTRRSVLFAIPTLRSGGAEKVIVTLVQHLDPARFSVALAVGDLRESIYAPDLPADVELIDLRAPRVRFALPKLVALIWHRRPDVVFSTLSHLNLALALVRPLLSRRIRVVARETSLVSRTVRERRWSWAWRFLYRWAYPNVDVLVCQSHAMLDDLVQNFDFPVQKAVVIHNPVDIAGNRSLAEDDTIDTQFGGGCTQLVAAGRLVPVKGFDLLIHALALCPDEHFRVTILGDGPLRAELEALARKLGVEARVRFAGFQRNPFPFYAKADWFVLSSRFEGFPNAALEALSCGTPVVAVPAPGGLREMLAGIPQARYADEVSARALAECLARLPTAADRVPAHSLCRFGVGPVIAQYELVFRDKCG